MRQRLKNTTRDEPVSDPMQESRDKLDELAGAMRINKHALDDEWLTQPDIMGRVGEGHALAISYRDQAKLELDETIARVDKELRDTAERNEEKLTEAQVKHLVKDDVDVRKAARRWRDWSLLADLWEARREAFKTRTNALGKLSELYIAGYWGVKTGAQHRREADDRRAEDNRQAMGRERDERRTRQ